MKKLTDLTFGQLHALTMPSALAQHLNNPALRAVLTSREMETAKRVTARQQPVPRMPGASTDYCAMWDGASPLGSVGVDCLADLICRHCESCGVPAGAFHISGGCAIRVETTEIGAEMLRYQLGLAWGTVQAVCREWRVSHWMLFPWVQPTFTGRINPALRPLTTPDAAELATQILRMAN